MEKDTVNASSLRPFTKTENVIQFSPGSREGREVQTEE